TAAAMKGARQPAPHPPSAESTAPLMFDASSDASHDTAVAISSDLAMRSAVPWIGVSRPMPNSLRGAAVVPMLVSTPPGITMLQRTLSGAYTHAIDRVRPTSACFEVV